MLRIELAESLVNAGKIQYKKYITGSAETGNGSDMDVKLVALDALMQMNEEKALPILKKIIRESKDKNIRAKAVFVLSQHDDPSVPPLLGEIARKDEDPYVREQAVFWLGQEGGEAGMRSLIDLYAGMPGPQAQGEDPVRALPERERGEFPQAARCRQERPRPGTAGKGDILDRAVG